MVNQHDEEEGMRKRTGLVFGVAAFLGLIAVAVPLRMALADREKDRADYQRSVDKHIEDLKLKIDEVRDDHRKDGVRVEQKIKEYQDRIAEIKRDEDTKLRDMTNPNWDTERTSLSDRMTNVRKDFYEWRLKRSVASYEDKIENLKNKNNYETNADKKHEVEEKIKKLEAKYNAAQAKLNDLRMTNGQNWDTIQHDLEITLREIDEDFEAIK